MKREVHDFSQSIQNFPLNQDIPINNLFRMNIITKLNLSSIKLENPYFSLPGCKIQQKVSDKPRRVEDYHFCRSNPSIRKNPKLMGLSSNTLQMLGLDSESVRSDENSAEYLSGSKLLAQSKPIAHNYCGYQFGSWAGQLGDGRAHTLGNVEHEGKSYELQLKGSGLTPFSRFADGYSVVSSAVREFLASELMAGLMIPTTRAASIVSIEQLVKRDPFYNGNIKLEKGAIVLRVCQTFLRFGSLQVCNDEGQMNKYKPIENRKILLPLCDYIIKNNYKDIDYEESDPYEQFYKRVVKGTAELVAHWQSIGFVHGVLNTDNMSLLSVTIDYGPYAFIDYFSKDYVSNASDQHQRHSYRRQPDVVKWNLQKLAEALDPVIPTKILLKYLQANYQSIYENKYYQLMTDKIGIKDIAENRTIIDELIDTMHYCGTNFTQFFRVIEENTTSKENISQLIEKVLALSCPNEYYLKNLRAFPNLIGANTAKILEQDSAFNLFFLTEQKIRYQTHMRLVNESCKERTQKERKIWRTWFEKYLGCRVESQFIKITNIKYVLLNFIAKNIIEELESLKPNEQQELLEKILKVFQKPYKVDEWFEEKYWKKSPIPVKLTCSS